MFDIVYNMNSTAGSSETLTCPQCGRIFSTIDDLNEHQKTEQQDTVERSKGFIEIRIIFYLDLEMVSESYLVKIILLFLNRDFTSSLLPSGTS